MSLSQVELLAPAGDKEKLNTALYFGADAVYLGGKQFSLRTFADNFSRDGLREAVAQAHALDKKIYVTANVFAKNADFVQMADYFVNLSFHDRGGRRNRQRSWRYLSYQNGGARFVCAFVHASKYHQQVCRQILGGAGRFPRDFSKGIIS